ncbi:ABC transporter permease [Oscillibacter sp. MSJ-2]|uniref:ABC transporter permease n=1 Tax=Dysosmobacter acutus TaxID=2841504 RepID=A0ABS6F5N5_9FIRM|nr:ABC transporter permease [Dysosmobacter acutus]MBU5625482.1 ABC transporter permease [Dysosmobacter acutus]
MLKFIGKRLLMMVPVIIGISFIIFSIMELTPGDPARIILGQAATEEAVAELREEMGLNQNFFIRYGTYILNALQGNFGESYRTQMLVTDELVSRIPATLLLTLGATILMVAIGIPIGVISAVRQYSVVDVTSTVLTLILTSMPSFWLGLMLMLYVSLQLNLLPATGIDTWKNFILPCITLSSVSLATIVRITRSNMLEVIRADYIRTARAKGAAEKQVVLHHALRNALLPIITIVGLNFAVMMGGAVVIESVFAIPGVGTLLLTSIRAKDTPTVMACTLFIAFVIGFTNLLVDILYAFIDPRLKAKYTRAK